MKLLQDKELRKAKTWFHQAAVIAQQSTCGRARCGSIIVSDEQVIGSGYNSPPGNIVTQCRCDNRQFSDRFKSDRTCCIHAEQRAIMDVLVHHPDQIKGSLLYFTRVNERGEIVFSDEPYCTICSKMALDSGVAFFLLWHQLGICCYPTEEYNQRSFEY